MTTTLGLAIDVLTAALDHCYKHVPLDGWAPEEYIALESDDQNLVDREIEGILQS